MEKEAKLLDFFKTLNALGLKCNLSDIDLLKSTFKSINYELRDTNINRRYFYLVQTLLVNVNIFENLYESI